jgi:hypothetical protein
MKRTGYDGAALFTHCCSLIARAFPTLAVALACVLALFPATTAAETTPKTESSADVFFLNEDLTYEVSWMGIPLGSIRTIVTRRQGDGDGRTATAVARINSYSGVPFVDLHETDETTMDPAGIPLSFQSREKADEKWKFTEYTFDQKKHRLVARVRFAQSETGSGSVLHTLDTLTIANNCVDGLSLLFYARVNARSVKQTSVPTFIKGKQGTTLINFYRKATSIDIDAVDYPVDVVEIDGKADFSGILGMNGEFTGWFSNDTAQIPIKGKFKILLGSITIELKQWNRTGWSPPRR